jgi:glycosyltransferase involved in cell wall biosynthesis
MKLVVATLSASREAGGLFESVRFSSRALLEAGVEVDVMALRDRFTREDLPRWEPLQPKVVDFTGPRQFLFSPEFGRTLEALRPDLMHTHGLWQPSSLAVWRHHKKRGVPYVVSPRGMLDPWALANSGWKKKLAGAVFENRHLRGASCLHALCEAEADAMRAYGLSNPIAVIPNGVVLPEAKQYFGVSVRRCFGVQPEEEAKKKTLLFLGRLHPKKGLAGALRGWAEATQGKEAGWRLVIAGWDQGGHEAELKKLCGELGLRWVDVPAAALTENRKLNTGNSSVIFAGPAFGETKEALLRSVDAFILPSLSEGLPMSVLEAWAYGLPVLMTEECNLPEGFAAGAAIGIGAPGCADQRTKGPEVRVQISEPKGQTVGIATGMRRMMEMTEEERKGMGAWGRALVEERFTWPKVVAQMKALYEWVLGTGPRPDCVRTVR